MISHDPGFVIKMLSVNKNILLLAYFLLYARAYMDATLLVLSKDEPFNCVLTFKYSSLL